MNCYTLLVLLIVVMEVHQNRGIKVFERRNAVGSIIIKSGFCNATGPTITNSVSLLVLVLLAHVFFQVLHILWSIQSSLQTLFSGTVFYGFLAVHSINNKNAVSWFAKLQLLYLQIFRQKNQIINYPNYCLLLYLYVVGVDNFSSYTCPSVALCPKKNQNATFSRV